MLLEFVLLAFVMIFAYGGKISPPTSAEVLIPKVEVSTSGSLFYQVFCRYFDSYGEITYKEDPKDENNSVKTVEYAGIQP